MEIMNQVDFPFQNKSFHENLLAQRNMLAQWLLPTVILLSLSFIFPEKELQSPSYNKERTTWSSQGLFTMAIMGKTSHSDRQSTYKNRDILQELENHNFLFGRIHCVMIMLHHNVGGWKGLNSTIIYYAKFVIIMEIHQHISHFPCPKSHK